ncbi:MAG: FUSC family protein [Aquaticitalea sp.]
MRQLLIILGFIASILAVILSVTPLTKIAYIPAIAALVFGALALYLSKQKQYPKKAIQLIFLLTIISLTITTYKAVFDIVEVGDIEGLELKEKESEEEALEELENIQFDELEDIQLNENDLDVIDLEDQSEDTPFQK